MRKYLLIAAFTFFVVSIVRPAHAQQFDIAFGVRTITAPSATSAPLTYTPQSIGGGAYPTLSADYLFFHNFGIGGEVSWRASQNLYLGYQPYRPIFYDFNGVWAPPLGKHASLELSAGIGAQSVRFYQPYYNCNYISCTNYTSSNHFMGDVGAGLRVYVHGGIFVRPEVRNYFVHNNYEFSGSRATSFGLSIGFSARSEQD